MISRLAFGVEGLGFGVVGLVFRPTLAYLPDQ